MLPVGIGYWMDRLCCYSVEFTSSAERLSSIFDFLLQILQDATNLLVLRHLLYKTRGTSTYTSPPPLSQGTVSSLLHSQVIVNS
jgi:hypothetical protein